MFGMGFMEIMLVAIVAVIALGPEKLPTAMVDIAKMLKKLKSGLDDAKSSLDEELKISDMKAEANKFKAQFEDAKSSVTVSKKDLGIENLGLNSSLDMGDLLEEDAITDAELIEEPKKVRKKPVKKTRKPKVKKEIKEEVQKEEIVVAKDTNEDANKFKVNFDEDEKKSENV